METIKCKACGSTDVIVQDGYYVCQYCGTKSLSDSQVTRNPKKQIPVLPKNYVCPEGALDGLFSVGPNEWVLFSKGNLQNQASTGQWRFAEHQYDIVGEASQSGWSDLFGWDVKGKPDSRDTAWYTPTIEQWGYVLKKRCVMSDLRFAKAQVVGVNGLILVPDSWNSSFYTLNKANRIEAGYTDNVINGTDWETYLQARGAVFLPAAGRRNGAQVFQAGSHGYYWSSTGGSFGRANCMLFDAFNLDPSDGRGRSNGYSMRLVCPVKS